jgi:group I intron endonuclease
MVIRIENIEDLDRTGIYLIKNIINNKVYIGSTGKSFKQRYTQHKSKLTKGKHGTPHLQNAWDKHGSENFEFSIVEICDEDIIIKETEYISKYDACNRDKGYNNNPNPEKSCATVKEVQEKISQSLKKGYEEGRLTPTSGSFPKGNIPWNKGYKYEDTSAMKVPKTITNDLQQAWENSKERGRERANAIEVYNEKNVLLHTARSLQDLEEWSTTDANTLPIKGNYGKKIDQYRACKACKSGKLYKGLYFKSVKKSPSSK